MERRLAAILAADIVGYSRLMAADEAGTFAALKARRKDVLEPLVAKHRGRIFKLMGDGAFVEFASAVNAVECAVEVQKSFAAANDGLPADRQVRLRIGVNLGDVMVDGGDLYGDGVNLAARLQETAEPDGICVSAKVQAEIAGKPGLACEDLGERTLKNIAQPVRVFRLGGAAAARPAAETAASARPEPFAAKPSVAVLPFLNMSGEAEQEFFADGLTEDILTELSRFRDLFVISRNSSFRYKGKTVDVQRAAKELGVQYVLEGSVRKAGKRVRVTVQLIDAATDRHLWAERYDRELADIFAIQDEVTAAIVATLAGRVEAATRDRAQHKRTENMAAYECVLAGKTLHHRSAKADNAEAMRLLDRAIALDPNYAHAHAWKACVLGQAWTYGWCQDREYAFKTVLGELQTALALDDNDSDVHRILAAVNLTFGNHDKAAYHQERALSLNPNDDLIVVQQGEILTWLGRAEEGVDWIRKAMRLNPYHPERFWNHLGRAYFVARRYGEAIEAFKRITVPDHLHHAFLAACYAQLGDAAAAADHAQEVLKREPKFRVADYLATLHYKRDEDLAHHREGLLKARLPA
jgi:adenylate cyclase